MGYTCISSMISFRANSNRYVSDEDDAQIQTEIKKGSDGDDIAATPLEHNKKACGFEPQMSCKQTDLTSNNSVQKSHRFRSEMQYSPPERESENTCKGLTI